MSGSKMKIWKQDPSVIPIGIRTTYIHSQVEAGPKDHLITIQDMPTVYPDMQNDFLFIPEENPHMFDAVHTFAVVRQVVTIFERALNRVGNEEAFSWQWGDQPIKVFPRAGHDINAYYSRTEQALRFFYFHSNTDEKQPLVFTCRSYDIIAHEVGHAVLDALRPGYLTSGNPQAGGLHESFGDLTAIFTMLAQMDVCEAIIAESKANLHAKSFFPAVAEQFGEALYGHRLGLRNADNDLKLSDVSNQVHDLSQVFTGAIYDILADMFEDHASPDQYDHAETLFRVGKHITDLVIRGIINGPEKNVTYKDIAEKMIEAEQNDQWKKFIHNRFAEREVFDEPQNLPVVQLGDLSWEGCSGTLRHPDRLKALDSKP